MAKEKEWSEIWEDIRVKAKAEAEEIAEEFDTRLKVFIEKAQKANLREEVSHLLSKVEGLTKRLQSTNGSESKAKAPSGEKPPLYVEPDGTPRYRKGKWSERYTDAQLRKMRTR